MSKKESKRYSRQQGRVNKDLVTRPNEVIKRSDDKGNMKLTFKSPEYYERDLFVTDKSLLSKSQIIKETKTVDTDTSGMTIDLSDTDTVIINMTQDVVVEDFLNFDNGIVYKIYIKQDDTGGHLLTFDESMTYFELDDDVTISGDSNSYSQLRMVCHNDTLFGEYIDEYKKYIAKPTGSLSFTIDTTLGENAGPTYKLQTKPDYVYTNTNTNTTIEYDFNYDFIVDWGDGTSDHITSPEQTENEHTYSENGEYTITITGLCEGFGFGYTTTNDLAYTSMDAEKIISVGNLENIGLIDAFSMFGFFETPLNITNVDATNWYTSKINNMAHMFGLCIQLPNIDVSNWNVSNVKDMTNMFIYCQSLTTIDISNWNISNVYDMNEMFRDTPLDTSSYDALLIGWSSLSPNLQDDVTFTANLAQYTPGGDAEAARDILINEHNWTINDAGPVE